ncbi:hypothetical protein AMJ40_02035 [candidate division TA06 bacterium DG_26]|uniref:DNA-directed RNA polymerase subunit alpha n=1 Tax=candidate division TA06 bacterium DG_26 TaxID=1703771 RepID=A0A0S7WKQ4_UNCT6|nr:MAG: hypothetical protein AMJ40_02035 [candidate division TA06 bacterium DG_26]
MEINVELLPKKVITEEISDQYGRFIISPLERGYGMTIGNALRRVLLSSIPGAAVVSCRVEGILHEFSTVEGVLEDIPQLILNLKRVRMKLFTEKPKILTLTGTGKRELRAGDISTDGEIEIVNPDLHIATLEDKAKLTMELTVEKGVGYVSADQLKKRHHPIGTVFMDALFSPVLKVNYKVEPTRVGHRTDYDKLILEIWTDGTMKPEDALKTSARIVRDVMDMILRLESEEGGETRKVDEERERIRRLLGKKVEELELSVRANKCLKAAKIHTIRDLVQKSEREMLSYKNFGKKSLGGLKKLLEGMGLSFGMDVSAYLQGDDETQTESEETGQA